MPELAAQCLLQSPTVTIRDVRCQGSCRQQSAEEYAAATERVFPYPEIYVRRLANAQVVPDANQGPCFTAGAGNQVSHPWPGGGPSLSLSVHEPLLRELAPAGLLRESTSLAFRPHRLRIDARTQALVALLRHRL